MNCLTMAQMRSYADGELSRGETKMVEDHLAACPACRSISDKIARFDAVIRASPAPPFGRPPRAGPGCPDAETVAALMEGRIEDVDERERVAAHVAGCPACAVKAAEADEAMRLVDRLEARGLEQPPPALVEAVRAKLCPRGPALLGEIAASIKELFERFRAWAPARPAASIAEPCAGYAAESATPLPPVHAGAKPAPPAPKRAKPPRGAERSPPSEPPRGETPPQPPGAPTPSGARRWALERAFLRGDLAVMVSLAANERRRVECTVRLTDRSGHPLPAVPVEMRKGTAMLAAEPTGSGGEALFGELVSGQYQFLIRRGDGARIGVTLH